MKTDNNSKNLLTQIKEILYKTSVGGDVMEDLRNFESGDGLIITPQRILKELEWKLSIVEDDGWENHLDNYQQIKSLKCLIKKVQIIIERNIIYEKN